MAEPQSQGNPPTAAAAAHPLLVVDEVTKSFRHGLWPFGSVIPILRGASLEIGPSQIKDPLTTAGKIVDVVLEVWAIFVVTAVAGSFATFFSSGDSRSSP
jgi:hypothetical protein